LISVHLRGWIDNTIDNTLVSPQQIKRKLDASCFSLPAEGGQYAGPHSNGLLSNKNAATFSSGHLVVSRIARTGQKFSVRATSALHKKWYVDEIQASPRSGRQHKAWGEAKRNPRTKNKKKTLSPRSGRKRLRLQTSINDDLSVGRFAGSDNF
jgi:hypothetical protein